MTKVRIPDYPPLFDDKEFTNGSDASGYRFAKFANAINWLNFYGRAAIPYTNLAVKSYYNAAVILDRLDVYPKKFETYISASGGPTPNPSGKYGDRYFAVSVDTIPEAVNSTSSGMGLVNVYMGSASASGYSTSNMDVDIAEYKPKEWLDSGRSKKWASTVVIIIMVPKTSLQSFASYYDSIARIKLTSENCFMVGMSAWEIPEYVVNKTANGELVLDTSMVDSATTIDVQDSAQYLPGKFIEDPTYELAIDFNPPRCLFQAGNRHQVDRTGLAGAITYAPLHQFSGPSSADFPEFGIPIPPGSRYVVPFIVWSSSEESGNLYAKVSNNVASTRWPIIGTDTAENTMSLAAHTSGGGVPHQWNFKAFSDEVAGQGGWGPVFASSLGGGQDATNFIESDFLDGSGNGWIACNSATGGLLTFRTDIDDGTLNIYQVMIFGYG